MVRCKNSRTKPEWKSWFHTFLLERPNGTRTAGCGPASWAGISVKNVCLIETFDDFFGNFPSGKLKEISSVFSNFEKFCDIVFMISSSFV